MNSRVKLIHPDNTITEAADKMKEFDVGMLPIAKDDKVIGVITDRDLVVRGIAGNGKPGSTEVSKIMSTDIIACYDDQNIDEVAQTMKENKVRRVIVLNRKNDQMAGVISLGDLAGHTNAETSGEVLSKVSQPDH